MLTYFGTGWRQYGRWPVVPATRNAWEFQAVISGRLVPDIDEQLALPYSDMLWVFPPSTVHGWEGDGESEAEVVIFHFASVPLAMAEMIPEGRFLAAPLSTEDREMLRALAREAEECLRHPSVLDPLHHQHILSELCLLALRGIPRADLPPPPDLGRDRVNLALTWLRDHLHERPSVAAMARAIYLSESQLRRLFQKVHGQAPQTALQQMRLTRACELLEGSALTIEAIAPLCGFATPHSFSRAFKRAQGVPPQRWRAAHQPAYQSSP